ncbi:hypothetical protein H4R19_001406 [Coemansia spiralis]|nr:hypothetical protein H4R19_001406 [Coemansia spiralis]
MAPEEAGSARDSAAAAAPGTKSYAAAVAAAGAESAADDSHAPRPGSGDEADADGKEGDGGEYGAYSADEYTEDNYTDEYNDEPAFSDSNYDESNYSADSGDEDGEDARMPSSPGRAPLAAEQAVDALAPPHRFVSHTPWGTSTGRLTRDQRHRAPLLDDPAAATNGQPTPGALQQPQDNGPVVNMVPVQEGTESYTQLQQQIQRERQLQQQDTLDAKQPQSLRGRRIVTIAQFIKSVSRLVSIGYPRILCTESCLTAALVAVLGARTGLDVWFANFNARTVHAVVTYDRGLLLSRLLPEYLAMLLPMAAVNQAIKWVIASLTIALRVRLGRYAHARYVDGITNITWSQLHRQGAGGGATPAYERPDWLLTVQIHRFADMLPRLVADVVKPTMDWCVFSRLLSRVIGRRGSLTMVLYVVLANVVIRLCSPPTGQHAGFLAQLEEKYRSVYARVSSTIQRAAAASTPLVFQAQQSASAQSSQPNLLGQQRQQQTFVPRVQAEFRQKAKDALDDSLNRVASSVAGANIRRFFGGIGETVVAKYGATLTAYYLLALPLCTPGRRLASEIHHDPAAVMMSYSRNSAYLINLSQATTRLLLMLSDLPKFVWSTVKVDRLLRSLDVHSRYRSAVETLPDNNDHDDHSSGYSSD